MMQNFELKLDIPKELNANICDIFGLFESESGYQVSRPKLKDEDFNYQGEKEQSFADRANNAQNRGAEQASYQQANFARDLSLKARDSQAEATNMYRDAAMGNAPSAAAIQQQQGLESAQRAQASMAASARGGLARGAAQRMAMQNAGDMGARAVGDAAMLRAREMEAARAGYAQASSQLRGQDSDLQKTDAATEQFNVEQRSKQRAANDAYDISNREMGQKASLADQAGRISKNEQEGKNFATESAINSGVYNERAKNEASIAGSFLTGAGTAIAGAFKSDKRSKQEVSKADSSVKEFLDALAAYNFNYKDSEEKYMPGKQTGIMAQDLEKSKIGSKFVEEDEDGTKRVNFAAALPVMMASLATINKRQNELEKAFKSMSKKGK